MLLCDSPVIGCNVSYLSVRPANPSDSWASCSATDSQC